MNKSQILGASCAVAVLVGMCGSSPASASGPSQAELDKIRLVAREKFNQACKSSGEKIYTVVRDVESIHLAKMRVEPPRGSLSNQYWDEAGLPLEETGDDYVLQFLARERRVEAVYGPSGVLTTNPGDHPGYQYVTVRQNDGSMRFLYMSAPSRGNWQLVEGEKREEPKYEVTFNPIDDVELRKYWIAGMRIEVRSRKTGSLMAERISFTYHPGQGHANVGYPWLSVYQCPETGRTSVTRQFVEHVLIPKGETE